MFVVVEGRKKIQYLFKRVSQKVSFFVDFIKACSVYEIKNIFYPLLVYPLDFAPLKVVPSIENCASKVDSHQDRANANPIVLFAPPAEQ